MLTSVPTKHSVRKMHLWFDVVQIPEDAVYETHEHVDVYDERAWNH
jgi:hypothetical protein